MTDLITTEEVISIVNKLYDFTVKDCKFHGRSFHDNFLIITNKGDYFLRIYRPNIRSLTDVLYELNFVSYLHSNGLNVSYPIPQNDGSFVSEINKDGIRRMMALFSFALGEYPDPTDETCYLFGRYIASFQDLAAKFKSAHERTYKLDINYIVDRSLGIIRPSLAHRPNDLEYLETLSEIMKEKFYRLPQTKITWGNCHGDLHFMNLYIHNKNITLFDFDCCAPGYLAYDLGTIRWELAFLDDEWKGFLDGYTSVRNINKEELSAISIFATICNYWSIAHNIQYSNIYEIDECYWDNNMKHIKKWCRKNNYL